MYCIFLSGKELIKVNFMLFALLFCFAILIDGYCQSEESIKVNKSVESIFTSNSDENLAEKIQYLLDREEITSKVKYYALSMDTRDWDLHRSIFTENYQLFRNGSFRDEHIDDRIKRLDSFTKKYAWTQHLASIYKIEITSDEAYVISSVNARHKGKQRENGRRSPDYLMTGHYHYWLKKTDDGWKIYKMRLKRNNSNS